MASKAKNAGDGLIVTVEQDVLSKALSAVVGTVARRVTVPILETVLLAAIEAGSANDLALYLGRA